MSRPNSGSVCADGRAVQRRENRHPLRGRDDPSDERHEQRAELQDPGNEPRQVDRLAVAIEERRRHADDAPPCDRKICIEEPVGDERRHDEEHRMRDERRHEDRLEVNFSKPEPVGRAAGEPRRDEHVEDERGGQAQHDPAKLAPGARGSAEPKGVGGERRGHAGLGRPRRAEGDFDAPIWPPRE